MIATRLEIYAPARPVTLPDLVRGNARTAGVLKNVVACFGDRYSEIDVPWWRVADFPHLGWGKGAHKRHAQDGWLLGTLGNRCSGGRAVGFPHLGTEGKARRNDMLRTEGLLRRTLFANRRVEPAGCTFSAPLSRGS